jgi:hypothetical protein
MALVKYNNNSISAVTETGLATGSLVLIKTQTASGATAVDFTHGTNDVVFDGTYNTYVFKFINIHPSNENIGFSYNFSTDGQSTAAVKTTVAWRSFHNESGSGGVLDYQSAKDVANAAGDQPITWDMESDNDASVSGELFVFSPASTTFVKHFMHQSNGMHSNPACFTNFSAGYVNVTAAVNSVRFLTTSNTFDGTIKLYGLKES